MPFLTFQKEEHSLIVFLFLISKLIKLIHVKFHGLMYLKAARIINSGIKPLIVSNHLQHSSTKQTLNTYSHLFPKITQGITDKLI